jgi:hypothetical protein
MTVDSRPSLWTIAVMRDEDAFRLVKNPRDAGLFVLLLLFIVWVVPEVLRVLI